MFAIVAYFRDESMLAIGLVAYGICLGMTHTPAALLLASVIDNEEGAAKDAVNGIFHTTWEAGGSLGFLLGGLLAERYHEQMALLTWYTICCAACAMAMVTIASWPAEGCCLVKDKVLSTRDGYGSVAKASDDA
jgi:predicted MFS family arabinose efflux permease